MTQSITLVIIRKRSYLGTGMRIKTIVSFQHKHNILYSVSEAAELVIFDESTYQIRLWPCINTLMLVVGLALRKL